MSCDVYLCEINGIKKRKKIQQKRKSVYVRKRSINKPKRKMILFAIQKAAAMIFNRGELDFFKAKYDFTGKNIIFFQLHSLSS